MFYFNHSEILIEAFRPKQSDSIPSPHKSSTALHHDMIIICMSTDKAQTFCFYILFVAGADLGFSRGGGAGFQKNVKNFDDLFYKSTKLIFWAFRNHYKDPGLAKCSTPQTKFWKNYMPKKTYLGAFSKFWTKNCVFSARALPSNLVYIDAKGASKKILGSVSQKWRPQNSTKGGRFRWAWDRIPEKKCARPPFIPQLNPPLICGNNKQSSTILLPYLKTGRDKKFLFRTLVIFTYK